MTSNLWNSLLSTNKCKFISSQCFAFIFICILVLAFAPLPIETSAFNNFLIKGNRIACSEEGQVIDISFLNDPCITCICQNSVIDCFQDTCPESLNCYYHLANSTNCCAKCKGCSLNGNYLHNGDTSYDADNVCQANHCNSGTLTQYHTQCYVPCENPILLRGQCCPSCNACPKHNAKDGEEVFISTKDHCVKCYCFKGQLICTRKVCPVLPCPKSNWLKPFNSCCPICRGNKEEPKMHTQSCLMNDIFYEDKTEFKYDDCTICICQNSTNICHRQTCPLLQCEESKQVKKDGQCCPICALTSTPKMHQKCLYKNRYYKDKESWNNSCETCICNDGKVHCSSQFCPNKFICPSGYQKVKINGACCESCVQVDASCLVKDELKKITTYDGKRYHLKGNCNYVLTRDCQTKLFSIHLVKKYNKFEPNASSHSKAIFEGSSLMVKINDIKIYLSHLGRVRVNRTLVQLPFIQMNTFAISRHNGRIKLRSPLGLEILWMANSSIEIKVKNIYQSKMCGLCGNFNHNADDEFQLKNSRRISTLEKFTESFEVGQNLLCPKRKSLPKKTIQSSSLLAVVQNSATRICDRIKMRYPHCTGYMSALVAYRRCIDDVNSCNNDKHCECLALEHFINSCKSKSPEQTYIKRSMCTVKRCPPGAEFKVCSYKCKKTCKNRSQVELCQRAKCRSGCECTGNRVLHNNQCIPEVMCP